MGRGPGKKCKRCRQNTWSCRVDRGKTSCRQCLTAEKVCSLEGKPRIRRTLATLAPRASAQALAKSDQSTKDSWDRNPRQQQAEVTTQLADGTFYDTTQRPLPSVTASPGSALVDFRRLPVHSNHDAYGNEISITIPRLPTLARPLLRTCPPRGRSQEWGCHGPPFTTRTRATLRRQGFRLSRSTWFHTATAHQAIHRAFLKLQTPWGLPNKSSNWAREKHRCSGARTGRLPGFEDGDSTRKEQFITRSHF